MQTGISSGFRNMTAMRDVKVVRANLDIDTTSEQASRPPLARVGHLEHPCVPFLSAMLSFAPVVSSITPPTSSSLS